MFPSGINGNNVGDYIESQMGAVLMIREYLRDPTATDRQAPIPTSRLIGSGELVVPTPDLYTLEVISEDPRDPLYYLLRGKCQQIDETYTGTWAHLRFRYRNDSDKSSRTPEGGCQQQQLVRNLMLDLWSITLF